MAHWITQVKHLSDYRLELVFRDGAHGVVDLKDRIVGRGGVLVALEDPDIFSQVRVDPTVGTVVWPNGVDFCPTVLHGLMVGEPVSYADDVEHVSA